MLSRVKGPLVFISCSYQRVVSNSPMLSHVKGPLVFISCSYRRVVSNCHQCCPTSKVLWCSSVVPIDEYCQTVTNVVPRQRSFSVHQLFLSTSSVKLTNVVPRQRSFSVHQLFLSTSSVKLSPMLSRVKGPLVFISCSYRRVVSNCHQCCPASKVLWCSSVVPINE